MNHVIDLRSDTVTQPTEEMRKAMYEAEVGDDVLGEDPTVNELQRRAAQKLGLEAAVFVPTGTMGNLISAKVHCQNRKGSILAEAFSHVSLFERRHIELLTERRVVTIEGKKGYPAVEKVREIFRSNPSPSLFCLENTHNHAGGVPITPHQIQDIVELTREFDVPFHVDGARIFNAAVSLGVSAASLVRGVDSVMFCLSKGLSAPVGSLVVGRDEFVTKARDVRDTVGGGMRQCGILAAAGIVALEKMIDRLADDHARARKLAEGLSEIDGFHIEPEEVKTNILMISVSDGRADEYVRNLARSRVLVFGIDEKCIRMVTHRHVDDDDVCSVVDAAARISKKSP